ncbi:hypothetical protein KY495_19975 [Massilia sp. PAMC28688]|uniref:hypothetical protein n=1 Tax=Massilia sp. PAMC28688 TaxID=2861283 RepID=UPI001C63B363|nr:hypothetical protein [Massilia sp. PAMC28688]QYF92963.1 hypothetical protein KY495_19975 [Massilia sp. PAMC28688]
MEYLFSRMPMHARSIRPTRWHAVARARLVAAAACLRRPCQRRAHIVATTGSIHAPPQPGMSGAHHARQRAAASAMLPPFAPAPGTGKKS